MPDYHLQKPSPFSIYFFWDGIPSFLLSLLTSKPVAQGGLPGEGGTSGIQLWLQSSHEAQCGASSGIVETAVNFVVDAEK